MSQPCPFFSLFSYFTPRESVHEENEQFKGYVSLSDDIKVNVKKQKSQQYKPVCAKKNELQISFIKKQQQGMTEISAFSSQIDDRRQQIQVNIVEDQNSNPQFKYTPDFMYKWQPIIKFLKSVGKKHKFFFISLCFDSQTQMFIIDILKIALGQLKTISSPQNTTTFVIDIYESHGQGKQLMEQINNMKKSVVKDNLLNTEEYLKKMQFANQSSTIV